MVLPPLYYKFDGPIGITVDPSPRGVYMKRYPFPSQRWSAPRGLDIDNWEVLRLIGILKVESSCLVFLIMMHRLRIDC